MALHKLIKVALLTMMASMLAACGTNPVTGVQELQLVSQSEEVSIGKNQYKPTKQAQGGELAEFQALNTYISRVGKKIAKQSHRPDLPYEFVVLDNEVPNAWALPGGKIAINWGLLLEMDDEAELAAVLAHEIVHATARHGAKSIERGLVSQIALAGVMVGVATQLDLENSGEQLLLGGAMLGSQLILTRYGRHAELEADEYGIEYMAKAGYDPEAAVRLQETFVRLSDADQQNFIQGLFATHPPSEERVEQNKITAAKYEKYKPWNGWIVNRAQYQRMIKPLRALEKSNEKIREAEEEFKDREILTALNLAEEAQELAPNSANPHAMRAIIYEQQGKYAEAQQAIDQALIIRGDYFHFHELKSRIAEAQGDTQTALTSLEKAHNLLPTAQNSYALGNLNLAAGNTKVAQGYFSSAARTNSQPGREAARKLARIEMPDRPDKYIHIQGQLDQNARLYALVQNRSPITLRYATLEIYLPDGRQAVTHITQPLASGKTISIPAKLGDVDVFNVQNMRYRLSNIRTD